ncbi:cold-shock protein [bacterium]|jgi:CspA family cold shock protein|nr:cold-shock protein [bacterium]MDP6571331.1 cold shock domain-containing protein [Patescibacteria group bacterium]MDP6756232.1 cold shock domain-containing protein [Patescibacteria group bacterium]|tara:strand:+ start:46445 stop:46648 length:204 start_codon:yes stop_codon:yes gene_type:complete
METGTITKLISDKNFGFIKREGEDKDLFFHANELVDVDFASLNEGDNLTFEVEDGEKGPNAVKVSKA